MHVAFHGRCCGWWCILKADGWSQAAVHTLALWRPAWVGWGPRACDSMLEAPRTKRATPATATPVGCTRDRVNRTHPQRAERARATSKARVAGPLVALRRASGRTRTLHSVPLAAYMTAIIVIIPHRFSLPPRPCFVCWLHPRGDIFRPSTFLPLALLARSRSHASAFHVAASRPLGGRSSAFSSFLACAVACESARSIEGARGVQRAAPSTAPPASRQSSSRQ